LFTCNTDGNREKKTNERRKKKNFNNNKKKKINEEDIDGVLRTYTFRHRIVLPTLTRRKEKTEKKCEKRMTETKKRKKSRGK
jgi:hypothetical protein